MPKAHSEKPWGGISSKSMEEGPEDSQEFWMGRSPAPKEEMVLPVCRQVSCKFSNFLVSGNFYALKKYWGPLSISIYYVKNLNRFLKPRICKHKDAGEVKSSGVKQPFRTPQCASGRGWGPTSILVLSCKSQWPPAEVSGAPGPWAALLRTAALGDWAHIPLKGGGCWSLFIILPYPEPFPAFQAHAQSQLRSD